MEAMNIYQAGMEDEWCRHLPDLHRMLADPTYRGSLPSVAARLDLFESCALWETLHYLVRTILGWRAIGEGLAWWYQAGQPVDGSPALALMKRHWGADGQIDYYAAWTWTQGRCFMGPDDLSPVELSRTTAQPDEVWWRNLKGRGRSGMHGPLFGGANSLHLGHSDDFGLNEARSSGARFSVEPANRSATLVVDGFVSWRADLERAASTLPPLHDRSWHVEVFDRQVGYLGLYRQSRLTGRWFAGPHGVHAKGAASG